MLTKKFNTKVLSAYIFLFGISLGSLLSCTGGGGGSSFGDILDVDPQKKSLVKIVSYTPIADPVTVTQSTSTTFAVTVDPSAGSGLTYAWSIDNVEQSTSGNSFYNLVGSSLPVGTHTVKVVASNGSSSDNHVFQVRKNSPPTISARTPGAAGNSVTCGAGSLALSVTTADVDGDSLTYTWKVNGASGTSFFINKTSTGSGATADFVPNCTLSGIATISVEVSDGHDTTIISPAWSVTIVNSGVANIDSVSPNTSPYVIIPSSGSKTFTMINVTGVPPLSYSWELESTPLPGEVSTVMTLFASTIDSLPGLGPYTLKAKVTDGTGAESSYSVQVLLNKPPVLSGQSPSTTTIARHHSTPNMTFSVAGSDENLDTLAYTWTIDGVIYDTPYSGLPAYMSINLGTPHQLIYNPDQSLVGSHTVSVRARESRPTDFESSNTLSWSLSFNHFSDECNQLESGQICTLVGAPGLGIDLNGNGRFDVATDKFKLRPNYIATHAVLNNDGITPVSNLFISDSASHVVWYYNRSDKAQTVLGASIAVGEIKPLIGNGASGRSLENNAAYTYSNFKLSYPEMIIYDSAADHLYVADRGNHRVVRIDSTGKGYRIFGNETNYQCSTSFPSCNADGGPARDHVCGGAAGIALDKTNNKLFVSCSTTHAIKEVNISNPDYTLWTARVLVGLLDGNSRTGASNANGAIFSAGAGRANIPWALALDSNKNLYFTQVATNSCHIRAVNLNTPAGLTMVNSTGTGTISVAQNTVQTIYGDVNCGGNAGGTPAATRFGYPRGLIIDESGGLVRGFYVTSTESHRVLYANNENVAKQIGGAAIAGFRAATIWGTGTGNYTGNAKPASGNTVLTPYGLSIVDNKLTIVEHTSYRIRQLNVSVIDGDINSLLYASDPKTGSSPDSPPVDAPNMRVHYLTDILFRSSDNSLLFVDTSDVGLSTPAHFMVDGKQNENNRVRRLDLNTGLASTVLGQGYGTYSNMQAPGNVLLHGIRGITFLNSNLLALDRHWTSGGNRSCGVYLYNSSLPNGSFYGTSVDNGRVGLISGDWSLGCNSESASGTVATSARQEAFSLTTTNDGSIYMTQFKRHCILQVTPAGTMNTFAGLCGTAGNSEGTFSNARFEYPLSIIADPRHPTNFFVIDQSNKSGSDIKYINMSGADVDIAGVTAPANEVKRVITIIDGYAIGLTVYKDPSDPLRDLICYTSGSGMTNVTATNTTTASQTALTVYELPDGNAGFHRVTCVKRSDGAKELVVGADSSNIRAGSQIFKEHEGLGIDATSGIKKIKALLFTPYGLTFDADGNLYIGERDGSVIRKVKKWW